MSYARTLFELTLFAAFVLGNAHQLAAQATYSPAREFGHTPFAEADSPAAIPPLATSPAAPPAADQSWTSADPLVGPVAEPHTPDDVFAAPPDLYASDSDEGGVGLRDLFPLFWGDPSLDGVPPVSDEGYSNGIWYFVDYDAFRGVPDGSWENNGIRVGFNYGTKLGRFSEITGIGAQVGASIGVYDWGGTKYRQKNKNKAETQGFLTYGLFRKPQENSPWSAALVQDWMFNDTFSVFGENPTLSQLRGQIGYAVSASNEFGVAGAVYVRSDSREVRGFGHTTWQPISTLSAYWHHKWSLGGPDTWITAGTPERTRLAGGGSVGDYLVSATALCPLSNAVSVFSNVTYMHQSASPGPNGANDEAWNFIVGISIYPRRNSRSQTVAGERWMPLLPTANNGSF
ncbi:MAG: DUF6666 family protein, partial [Planctomycetaceae bacterium]